MNTESASALRRSDNPSQRCMLVLALLTLAALVLLSMTVVFVPQVRAWDEGINVALGPYRTPTVLAISLWITALGAGATRIAVMTVAAALLWADGRTRAILPFWVCYLTAETVAWGAKYIIDRHRPEFLTVASAASPSFPSAHAAGSAAVYGLVALLVLRGFRPGLARPVVTAVCNHSDVACRAQPGRPRRALHYRCYRRPPGGRSGDTAWGVPHSILARRRVER